jgi:hypothetical protein
LETNENKLKDVDTPITVPDCPRASIPRRITAIIKNGIEIAKY